MKIDKVVFSSSELFAPFWNVQAKVWGEMGIEPVCLLWGKVENTDMDPSLGEIIEMEFNPDLFESFQITWSKFYHTLSEPDTTWIIGDMDQIPLRRSRFLDDIADLPDIEEVSSLNKVCTKEASGVTVLMLLLKSPYIISHKVTCLKSPFITGPTAN